MSWVFDSSTIEAFVDEGKKGQPVSRGAIFLSRKPCRLQFYQYIFTKIYLHRLRCKIIIRSICSPNAIDLLNCNKKLSGCLSGGVHRTKSKSIDFLLNKSKKKNIFLNKLIDHFLVEILKRITNWVKVIGVKISFVSSATVHSYRRR